MGRSGEGRGSFVIVSSSGDFGTPGWAVLADPGVPNVPPLSLSLIERSKIPIDSTTYRDHFGILGYLLDVGCSCSRMTAELEGGKPLDTPIPL